MIVDEQVKKIVQDFSKKDTHASKTDSSKISRSVGQSENSSSKRRTVIKLKNTLLRNNVSPEIRKLYYQQQKEQQITQSSKKSETEQSKTLSLPSLNQQQSQYQEDQLKELQQLILELYPPDHPLWTELIVDTSQSIEDVITANPDTFYGLLSKYLTNQGLHYYDKQVKNLETEKSTLGKKYSTQYSNDYSNKQSNDSPLLSNRIYDQFKSKDAQYLAKQSIYNSHFIPQQYLKTHNCKPDHVPNMAGMSFLSSYNSNFRDWNPKYHGKIGPLDPHLNQSLPFISQTNYHKDYKILDADRPKRVEPSKLGPFPYRGELLVKETASQSYFSSHASSPVPTYVPTSPKIALTKSYEGQYQSNFRKSFVSQNSEKGNTESFTDKYFHSKIIKTLMQKKTKTRMN